MYIYIFISSLYLLQALHIEAVPLILKASLPLPANSSCKSNLDAEKGPLFVYFNVNWFSVSLIDWRNNNTFELDNITVSINSTTHYDHFYKRITETSNISVSQFQFYEVNDIFYMLNNQSSFENDSLPLRLKFSYWHSTPVFLSVPVCIQPRLVPLQLHVQNMSVQHGGKSHITTTHLSVKSSRPGDDGSLLFHVLEGLHYGTLTDTVSGGLVDDLYQFTLTQLRENAVVYEHNGSTSAVQDQILFRVCSRWNCLEQEEVMFVSIHPLNVSVNVTGVSVKKGGRHVFSLGDFNVRAPLGFTVKLIANQSQHGEVKINSSAGSILPPRYFGLDDIKFGRFYYVNNGEENIHDNFTVRIEVENRNTSSVQTLEFVMWIDIEQFNDYDPEILGKGKPVVVNGGSVLITANFISAHDYDSDMEDVNLLWTLRSKPLCGYLYLDQDPHNSSLGLMNFTEADIRNNRLYYRNICNVLEDNLHLSVSDGVRNHSKALCIQVVIVNIVEDSEELPFSLDEGSSKIISYQHMHYIADNDDTLSDADFIITIKDVPKHGNLSLYNHYLSVNSSFTQDQIGTGGLQYSHDDSNTNIDCFKLEVCVPKRKNGTEEFEFEILIHSINDNPPTVLIHNILFVVAYQEALINSNILTIEDDDYEQGETDDNLIECKLVDSLRSGRLEKERFGFHFNHTKNFTKYDLERGKLWYRHVNSLEPDLMTFNITDGINHSQQNYSVSIIILPEIVPVTLNTLSVKENEIAAITEDELKVRYAYLQKYGGMIKVRPDAGPRHGKLLVNRTGNTVHRFTAEQISNGHIYYHHNGGENSVDSFVFVYEVLDPAGYNRTSSNETFLISIIPVNDQRPNINNDPSNLRLWANETVPLTERQFNVTDHDTPPNKVIFTISIVDVEMHVAYNNDYTQHIHRFTQAQLLAQEVVLVHIDGPHGTINYNVTDGVQSQAGSVTVIADDLGLDCDTELWKRIDVRYLGRVTVSTSNIQCNTTDDSAHREVMYSLPQSQQLGHFEVDSLKVTSFNSTILSMGKVEYVHTETDYWLENETLPMLVTSYPADPVDNQPLVIQVRYPQPRPDSEVAINRQLNLTEGDSLCLTDSVLDARNLRYKLWLTLKSSLIAPSDLEVQYNVREEPQHGTLTRHGKPTATFTQHDLANLSSICYTHDDSETHKDIIMLMVHVILVNGTAFPDAYQEQLLFDIRPRNDQQPLLQTDETTVVENFTYSLLALDLLRLEDGDTSPQQLIFCLTSVPSSVDLLLNGSVMAANSSFSQEDIDLNRLTLRPHRVGSASFRLTYTDGVYVSTEVVGLRLMVERHTLSLVHTNAITYTQQVKSDTAITKQHLDTVTNTVTSPTVFTVEQVPMNGTIVMDNREVDTFTQGQIDDGKIFYSPQAGAQHYSDLFVLNGTNANITLPQLIHMNVRIMVWGQVKEDININFTDSSPALATPLPGDTLVLNDLEKAISIPPTIMLMRKPNYGHLEMHVELSDTKTKHISPEISVFHYEVLQQGWIVYVWDYTGPLTSTSVSDTLEVLVLAEGFQSGEATIPLTISTPQVHTLPDTSASTPTTMPASQSLPLSSKDGGFPEYSLVPILGIILFLLVLIVIVVVFCLTHQKHIKLKLVSSDSRPPPSQNSLWSASPALHVDPVISYELDPSGIPPGLEEEEEQFNSETSSGFSEPDNSFNDTPPSSNITYQQDTPPLSDYIHPPVPPRSRMSNVTVTFSSHHSTASEEESDRTYNLDSLSLPHYTTQTFVEAPTAQLPARPATHTPVNCCQIDEEGGGGGSCVQRNRDMHPEPQRASQPLDHQQHCNLQQHRHIRDQLDSECLHEEDHTQEEKDELDPTQDPILFELSDHNLRNLFHPVNPILKKEEYWV